MLQVWLSLLLISRLREGAFVLALLRAEAEVELQVAAHESVSACVHLGGTLAFCHPDTCHPDNGPCPYLCGLCPCLFPFHRHSVTVHWSSGCCAWLATETEVNDEMVLPFCWTSLGRMIYPCEPFMKSLMKKEGARTRVVKKREEVPD